MVQSLRLRWGEFVPSRWSWLGLLAGPSSYLLVLALLFTAVAKAHVLRGMQDAGLWPGRLLVAMAPDIAVFLGVAAVLGVIERVWRYAIFLTVPVAMVVATIATINAVQLWITGEQLTAQVLVLGIERFTDVRAMARASIHVGYATMLLASVVLVGPLLAARLVLRRRGRAVSLMSGGADRARAAGAAASLGLILLLLVPVPEQLAGLYRNAAAHTTWGMVSGDRSWNGGLALFAGYSPHDLVEHDAIERLRNARGPNVVVIILESTRRDETTLARPDARAKTPHLVELAARGIEVTHARAVIPHTTKSIWSMLCGRLPILRPKLYETTSFSDVQCLPNILGSAGWRTGFLQSAIGRFEDRPRLVRRLGFREFLAAEQYTTRVAGYLATDDEALVGQFDRWLDASPATPFMVTVLTSATHHPYLLTDTSASLARENGLPTSTDRDRYDRQIEAADRMVGGILDVLRQRGVLDDTIIVVLGDHGEGFGDKAARQHAVNFYEEGLHVPWVMVGPGVPALRIDANASLLDLAPTLLDLLGVRLSAAAAAATHARSVLRISNDRVLPFSCFFDETCYGFVFGDTKVVSMRETGRTFAFDLAHDPDERRPIALDTKLRAMLDRVERTIDLHRTNSEPLRDPMVDFYPWNCPIGQPCGIKQ